jgi:hypothetical protein
MKPRSSGGHRASEPPSYAGGYLAHPLVLMLRSDPDQLGPKLLSLLRR